MRKLLAGSLSLSLALLGAGLAPFEAAAQVLERPIAPALPDVPLSAAPDLAAEPAAPLSERLALPGEALPLAPLSAAPSPSPAPERPGILSRIKAIRERRAAKQRFNAAFMRVQESLYIQRTRELAAKLESLEKTDVAGAQAALEGRWDGAAPAPAVTPLPGLGEQVSGRPAASRKALPAPVRILGTSAAVMALDLGARLALPHVFGFSPTAAVWGLLSTGLVVGPALAAVRIGLSRDNDPKLDAYKRNLDSILGVGLGGAIVTAVGLAHFGLVNSLAFVLLPKVFATGHISLAPLLGLLAMGSAIPKGVFSAQVSYALKEGRPVQLSLPIQPILKFFLLPVLFTPAMLFARLTGGPLAALAPLIGLAAFNRYFSAKAELKKLMLAQASPEAQQRLLAERITKKMREQGFPVGAPPGPLPALGRGMLIQGRDVPARPDVRGTGLNSLGALALLALGSLGIVAAHAAAVGSAHWPSMLPVLKSMLEGIPILAIAPFAMVLFSKGARVLAGPLFDTVKELAAKAKLPMPRVYLAKWKTPNAFATGFLHHLSIVAAAGPIMELLDAREMRAVMSHELSHVKYYHMLYFLPALFFLQYMPGHAVNLLQLAIQLWSTFAWVLLFSKLSRANEKQADHGGAALSGDPAALASALRKLTIYGALKSGAPPDTGNAIFNAMLNHPKTPDRIRYLDEMAPRPPAPKP